MPFKIITSLLAEGGRAGGECAQGVELFDPFPFVVCIIHHDVKGVSVVVKGYQDGGEFSPLTMGDCIS